MQVACKSYGILKRIVRPKVIFPDALWQALWSCSDTDCRLPFVYELTDVLTRFTNGRDRKPRSCEVLSFPMLKTVLDWHNQSDSLCERFQGLSELDPAWLRTC